MKEKLDDKLKEVNKYIKDVEIKPVFKKIMKYRDDCLDLSNNFGWLYEQLKRFPNLTKIYSHLENFFLNKIDFCKTNNWAVINEFRLRETALEKEEFEEAIKSKSVGFKF
jgi:hypothetical protein